MSSKRLDDAARVVLALAASDMDDTYRTYTGTHGREGEYLASVLVVRDEELARALGEVAKRWTLAGSGLMPIVEA